MIVRTLRVLLSTLLWCPSLPGGTSEYELKAAYVYNFAKFVDWPGLQQANAVTVCVYGKDPFGGFLDEAVRGKQAHGLPVAVKRLRASDEEWEGCHVLFLAEENSARLTGLLNRLRGQAILSIGESAGFAERGGMIGLVLDRDRVRFDINVSAITAAQLQVSSRLIEIGRVVGARNK